MIPPEATERRKHRPLDKHGGPPEHDTDGIETPLPAPAESRPLRRTTQTEQHVLGSVSRL